MSNAMASINEIHDNARMEEARRHVIIGIESHDGVLAVYLFNEGTPHALDLAVRVAAPDQVKTFMTKWQASEREVREILGRACADIMYEWHSNGTWHTTVDRIHKVFPGW